MDVLNHYEVDALLEAIEGKKLTEEDKGKYRQYLKVTRLSDDEKIAIQFLTKIAGFALVRWDPNTPEGGGFTGYQNIGGTGEWRLVSITRAFEPLSVLTHWEIAEKNAVGLRGELKHLMQCFAGIALERFVCPLYIEHQNDQQWLKKTAVDLMRVLLSMERLKKEYLDHLISDGKREE